LAGPEVVGVSSSDEMKGSGRSRTLYLAKYGVIDEPGIEEGFDNEAVVPRRVEARSDMSICIKNRNVDQRYLHVDSFLIYLTGSIPFDSKD
jgi:hypothetical protein